MMLEGVNNSSCFYCTMPTQSPLFSCNKGFLAQITFSYSAGSWHTSIMNGDIALKFNTKFSTICLLQFE